MKYAHYSVASGLTTYAIIILAIIAVALITHRFGHLSKPAMRFVYGLCITLTLFVIGDAIIWLNSWVYPPLSMPYDKYGEQITIFTYLIGFFMPIYIVSCAFMIGTKIRHTTHNEQIAHINREIAKLNATGGDQKAISDGHHTFRDLYFQRMFLTKIIAESYPNAAWKSKLHHDGTMFNGDFIVGFTTPAGQYSYHYKLEYWTMFNITELEHAPEYDGHKPEDIDRLLSLIPTKH